MTSQRSLLARGSSGALGVFGLLTFLCTATVNAAEPTKAAATAGAPAAAAPAAPAEAAPPTAAPAPGSAAAAAADQGAYTVRLRSLEKNVNELKEQIFR